MVQKRFSASSQFVACSHRLVRSERRHYEAICELRRAAGGQISGIVSFARDVSAGIRAEEAERVLTDVGSVHASSLDYEATLDRVAHAIVPTLADTCIIDVVDEEHAIHEAAVVHGDPVSDDRLGDLRRRLVTRVVETGEPGLYPTVAAAHRVVISRGSTNRQALKPPGLHALLIVPLVSRGQIVGAITLVARPPRSPYGPADLAPAVELGRRAALAIENARLYQQAQEAIRLRDTALASVSHDLRGSLTPIRLIAETLQWQIAAANLPESEPILVGLRRIDENARKMAGRITELLDIGRLQTGHQLHLNRTLTDLVALVRAGITDYQTRTTRHQFQLDTSCETLRGLWDDERVERVVDNLLSNAIKYSFAGGVITVRLRREEGTDGAWAVLDVEDRGAGIPLADLPRLFTWYFRAANVIDKVPGSGIGLAAAQQILKLHDGRMDVASQEGVGTTFTARLPLPMPAEDLDRRETPLQKSSYNVGHL